MKKKVLYVITKGNWGGAQKYVYDLATSLPSDKFKPLVACGEGEALPKKLEERKIKVIGLTNSRRNMNPVRDYLLFLDLVHLFEKEKPDVVHLNSSKIGGIGALAARLATVPKIVFTAHGWAFNEPRPIWQKGLIKIAHWFTVIFCHEVIVIAQKEYDQVKGWPLVSSKLHLIYNGIRPIKFLPRTEARKKLAEKFTFKTKNLEGYPWIGCLGELHHNKGYDVLFQAVTSLKQNQDWYCVVIGDGEEKEKLETIADKLGLVPHTQLVGHLSEGAQYLKAFDLFVLPSRKEGLPYTLLEAGLAELPTIATNVGGVEEIIPSPEFGLVVKPENPRQLDIEIFNLLRTPNQASLMGKKLGARTKKAFSFEKFVEQTTKIY